MGSKTRLSSYCSKRGDNTVNLVTSRKVNTRLARPITEQQSIGDEHRWATDCIEDFKYLRTPSRSNILQPTVTAVQTQQLVTVINDIRKIIHQRITSRRHGMSGRVTGGKSSTRNSVIPCSLDDSLLNV